MADPSSTDPVQEHETIAVTMFANASGPRPAAPGAVGRFADYELVQEIARGGMGVVYLARQRGLDRVVALKMILAGRLADEDEVRRFRLEAMAVAKLQHPHIVAVYDVGEQDGQHFFTMEYVPGSNLAKRITKEAMPGRLAASYLEQVARALHYAHEKGILHRDLKPANILLDEHDRPKLTDFGLAKVLPASGSPVKKLSTVQALTRTGAVMGTPSYMAPEQAAGTVRDLGPPCDVYGLGAVLYELLAGRPPFKAESPLETVLQVLNRDPAPPRLLNPNIDADLESICLKCLEKDPGLRYPTAAALAEDLQRYLNGEHVTARSINILDRISRTLAHSQHDKEFRGWGLGLMLFGVIIFVCHLCTSLLLQAGQPKEISYWVPRLVEFALLGVVLWCYRTQSLLLPTSSAERLIWAAWIGYLLAFFFMVLILEDALGHDHLATYPASLVLSGMAFFVMGGHVWGWCYVIGLIFMALGPIVAQDYQSLWTPLWFGGLWGLALLIVGYRYWRLGKAVEHNGRS
jgi:serine/threonine protein kinase